MKVMIQQKVRRKKRVALMFIFSTVSQNITGINKMWSLKSLVKLKCQSRNSVHAVQYN